MILEVITRDPKKVGDAFIFQSKKFNWPHTF